MKFNFGTATAGIGDSPKGCLDSVAGIFIGFILFGFGFLPAWCSERGVRAYSEEVAAIELTQADQAAEKSGLVKIEGEIRSGKSLKPASLDIDCQDIYNPVDVFWYDWEIRKYHSEVDSDGEVDSSWDHVDGETKSARSFMLGEIQIEPGNAMMKINSFETCEEGGEEKEGATWLTVKYLPVEDVSHILVVGELDGSKIVSGNPFFVTDMNDEQFIAKLAADEKVMRWIWTGLSALLFFIAFNLIIGPLMFVLKFVPVIGGGLRFMIAIGSLILAIILTFLIKLVVAFWWVLILVMIGVIVLIVQISKKKGSVQLTGASVQHASVSPVAAPITQSTSISRCPKCDDPVSPGEKFCDKCGYNLLDVNQVADPTGILCPECKHPISSGEKFCPACGHKMDG